MRPCGGPTDRPGGLLPLEAGTLTTFKTHDGLAPAPRLRAGMGPALQGGLGPRVVPAGGWLWLHLSSHIRVQRCREPPPPPPRTPPRPDPGCLIPHFCGESASCQLPRRTSLSPAMPSAPWGPCLLGQRPSLFQREAAVSLPEGGSIGPQDKPQALGNLPTPHLRRSPYTPGSSPLCIYTDLSQNWKVSPARAALERGSPRTDGAGPSTLLAEMI